MGISKITQVIRSLMGIMGKNGTTIATPANPFPVELDATSLSALELIGIKGSNGTAIVGTGNPLPVSMSAGDLAALELIGIKGKDASTVATPSNPLSVETVLPTLEEILKVKLTLSKKWRSVASVSGTIKTTYIAVAPSGTATSAAVWGIVRILENLGTGEKQIEGRIPMSYNNRADPTLNALSAWEAL